jgi:hypothetical protein
LDERGAFVGEFGEYENEKFRGEEWRAERWGWFAG